MTRWHIITPEYPPKIGGVADYTRLVAEGLAAAGDEVHVWTRDRCQVAPMDQVGVTVRPALGDLSRSALCRFEGELDRSPGPRRLLVQWVAHGYGYRGVNLWFCGLLNRRRRQGDEIDIMFHEVFPPLKGLPWHIAIAAAQRAISTAILKVADRVWVSTPSWERYLAPYNFNQKKLRWLPIPSTVTYSSLDRSTSECVDFGHFSTYTAKTAPYLRSVLIDILGRHSGTSMHLIGANSDRFISEIIKDHPMLKGQITASGTVPLDEVSHHIRRCVVMLQPYSGGITARNTCLIACLANGRPIVSNVGPLTEPFWAESRAVALADTHESIPELGLMLLGDRKRCRDYAENALSQYRSVFDIRHSLKALQKS